MNEPPFLTVNGQRQTYGPGDFPATLAGLVAAMGLDEVTVVAEVDGAIAPRGAFASVPLRPGQTVELVRFVGGG